MQALQQYNSNLGFRKKFTLLQIVFIFYGYTTNYHTLSSLKLAVSVGQVQGWPDWVLCSGSHKAQVKVNGQGCDLM